jgi:hypothetical protein
MYNQVTDRFGLVQTELVKAVPMFGRTISAIENYSLEVFHGEHHRGSVPKRGFGFANNNRQESQKMKVYNGDIIFWVNLVSQPVSISGSFMTKDKYIRIYDITIDLVISDPALFTQGYRLGKDPVNIAIEKFKSSLEGYASSTEHDKLVPIKQIADKWNNNLCAGTGMKIMQVSYWSLRDDPKRAEMFTILQEAEKNKASITTQAEVQKLKDKLERERDAEQRDFEREQEARQHMHQLHIRLRETAALEITDILRERIRDTFERNGSIHEVAEDSMKLLNAFHESLHRGSVVDSTLMSGPNISSNGTTFEADPNSSREESIIERDKTIDSISIPSKISDLSDMGQKETEEE